MIIKTLQQILKPQHTALIVVDIQNDFLHPQGLVAKKGMDLTEARKRLARIKEVIDYAQQKNITIVYLQQVQSKATFLPAWWEHWKSLIVEENTWGAEILEEFQPVLSESELVVVKRLYDGFNNTDLDFVLKTRGIKTMVSVGYNTNCCVESTVRTGFEKGYYQVVLSDCTYSLRGEEIHRAALFNFEKLFGKVMTAEELLGVWQTPFLGD